MVTAAELIWKVFLHLNHSENQITFLPRSDRFRLKTLCQELSRLMSRDDSGTEIFTSPGHQHPERYDITPMLRIAGAPVCHRSANGLKLSGH